MKALTTTITAFLLTVATALSVSASEKPNVLFITSDDLGLQLGCYGDTVIETPHLDALAASGVQFDVAYVAQASCSPSRSAMFTGLYPHASGQYGLTATRMALHPYLHDSILPNILKRAALPVARMFSTSSPRPTSPARSPRSSVWLGFRRDLGK